MVVLHHFRRHDSEHAEANRRVLPELFAEEFFNNLLGFGIYHAEQGSQVTAGISTREVSAWGPASVSARYSSERLFHLWYQYRRLIDRSHLFTN